MFLHPILSLPDVFSFFQDQFAFRPTGSTTASLIYLIHSISSLLQYNQHVHVISFDFSKAFDSVRHHTLFQKMSKYPIPDFLYNWLVSFFTDRSHCTKLGGSSLRYMTSTQVLSKARDWVPSRLCIMHLICTRLTLQIKYANTRTIST